MVLKTMRPDEITRGVSTNKKRRGPRLNHPALPLSGPVAEEEVAKVTQDFKRNGKAWNTIDGG